MIDTRNSCYMCRLKKLFIIAQFPQRRDVMIADIEAVISPDSSEYSIFTHKDCTMASQFYKKRTPHKLKQLDQSAIKIIEGINALLLQAQSENLTAISLVLEDARESIAWWAAYDDYDEIHSGNLARELTFGSAVNVAAALLARFAAIKDDVIRQELLEFMQKGRF